jgi:hypothetical protein
VDVSDEAELFVHIQYFDVKEGYFVDEILGCKQLQEHATREVILKILDNFTKLELD